MNSDAEHFYDDVWRRYGSLDALSPAAFHRRRLIRRLALAHAPRAHRVLDVGCGQGELLVELARALPGAALAGADVSEESRKQARRRCPAAEIFSVDLESSDFDAAQAARVSGFDLVVCSEVLEHLAADRLAAARLHRLLAPGGVSIVTVPGGRMSRFDELIGHLRHYSRRELVLLLEQAGFRVEQSMAWGFPFHNAYRCAVRLASRLVFRPGEQQGGASGIDHAASAAYGLSGRLLKPLYYLNRPRWGEQIIAVARKVG